MEQWQDATYARAWAERNPEESPERKQPLDMLLTLIADALSTSDLPRRVLDLGCGHGVVAARVMREMPEVTLLGVDGSPVMLDMAREHLAPFAGRFELVRAEFETMTPDNLPGGPFGVAFAVQAIHNTDDEGKKRAFACVHDVLAPSGLFLLLDRIRLASPALFGAYRSVWDVLGPAFNAQQREGRTFAEHERLRIERGDQPGSLEQNLLWLREAGFREVAALYVVGVRALIAAQA